MSCQLSKHAEELVLDCQLHNLLDTYMSIISEEVENLKFEKFAGIGELKECLMDLNDVKPAAKDSFLLLDDS